jgi:class 3 adenylate cyclase/sugar lactone lactonase YvrE
MPGRKRQQRRGVATVFFTDIVGSTALATRLGDQTWRGLLTLFHSVVRRAIRRNRGRQVDSAGDGVFAVFQSPADAIRCAMAATDELHRLGIEVRSGLHAGEVEFIGDKVGGIAVHLGARTCGEAGAGEILVTSTVRDLIEGSAVPTVDRGLHTLKGISGEWRLYAIVRSDQVPLDESALDAIGTHVARYRRNQRRSLGIRIGVVVIPVVVVVAILGVVIFGQTPPPQRQITTVAFSSAHGSGSPVAVASDPQGRIYVIENDQVLRIGTGKAITIAGTGQTGSSDDSGLATAAQLNDPSAVGIDSAGNVYIADTGNDRVVEVNSQGIIGPFAGNGQQGDTGDGGPATQAELNSPTGLAIGFGGSVLIADSGNNRIRVVAGAIIKAFAGIAHTGSGYNGDGGGANSATSALFHDPGCLAVDGEGNVYVADIDNNRIRVIDPSLAIDTVAGNGTAGFSGDNAAAKSAEINLAAGPPIGADCLAVDVAGDVFIADSQNNRIREVRVGGTIVTIAGNGQAGSAGDNGPAIQAQLALPLGVAVDASGAVYVADDENDRVRRIS